MTRKRFTKLLMAFGICPNQARIFALAYSAMVGKGYDVSYERILSADRCWYNMMNEFSTSKTMLTEERIPKEFRKQHAQIKTQLG